MNMQYAMILILAGMMILISIVLVTVYVYARWGFRSKKQLFATIFVIAIVSGGLIAAEIWAMWMENNRVYDTPREAVIAQKVEFNESGHTWNGSNPEPAYCIQGKKIAVFAVIQDDYTFFPFACYEDGGWKSDWEDQLGSTEYCNGVEYQVQYSKHCKETIIIVNTSLTPDMLVGNAPKQEVQVSDSMGSAFEAVQVRASNGKAYHQYYTILPQWEEGYTITIDGETDEPTPIWWR